MKGGGDLRRTLAIFGRFTLGQRRAFASAFVLLAIEAVTAVAVPDLIKKLTDFLKDGILPRYFGVTVSDDAAIYVIAGGIVVATAVNSFSASTAEINLATAGRTLGFNLRGALFAHLQRLPLAFHLRRSTGDVLTRITGDVKAMEDFIEDSVSDLVGSVLVLGATMAYLFWQSWQIALLAIAIVPLMAAISNWFARRIKSAAKQERASEGELASTAQEMLSAISLVQVYGRGDVQQRKFAQQSSSARDAVLRTARLDALFGFTVALIESVGIAVVILVGARLVDDGSLTAGALVAFILVVQGMFKPIRRIVKQWNRVAAVYASVDRVGEIFDRQPTVVDLPDARPAPAFRGEIEFRDVSFAYHSVADDGPDGPDQRLALESVSFQVARGESVALVGRSGAGKSTIAQLLPRLYDPHAGAILIDGHDIRQFAYDSVRSQMSMVLQETILLRGTVGENIAYGREGATQEEVIAAAKLASAHDFVMEMPNGYDSVLGERAATLSGGQRQRLAIARAFIRDAPILILDEPTTGLDAESSALVAESLQMLARNRSTLIVSHDLNLIRSVDRILVISAGRVLEEGSPADLLASGGLYSELHALQFGEAAIAATASPNGAPDGAPAGEVLAAVPAGVLDAVPGGVLDDGMLPDGPIPEPRGAPEDDDAQLVGSRGFDAALTRAMPLPASRDEYLARTGWIPSLPPPPARGGDDLDALRSPAVTRAVPGLAEALSARAMAPRLQTMLAEEWEVMSCSPGKPFVEPGAGATLQYRLELRRRGSARTVAHVVAGRLFRTVEDAEAELPYLPPAESLDGREDLRAFARPALVIRELCLLLHAVPLDPQLPGLVRATDPSRLVEILGAQLTSAVPGLVLQGCRAEVVRYARGSCVLRYEVAWQLSSSRRSLKQVVYGKMYGDDQGELVGPVVTALRAELQNGAGTALPFLVPRFQGYVPHLRLALLEAVPGSPLLPDLIKAGAGAAAPPDAGGLTAEQAVVACARVAAALHRTSLPVGAPRTLADEIGAVRASVDALAPVAPGLATSLHRHLGTVQDLALDPPGAFGAAHGDFDASQVLFDGPTTSLVDFDTVCLAEPALDLGRFTGRLSVTVRMAQDTAGGGAHRDEDIAFAFLREYLRATGSEEPDVLLARVAAYRTVALARLAVRSWCQLKPHRLRPALALLEEGQRAGVR
jgi:ABC-type multidrug transport system fused ATPase/permease subunit